MGLAALRAAGEGTALVYHVPNTSHEVTGERAQLGVAPFVEPQSWRTIRYPSSGVGAVKWLVI